jgi:hypothetical protein
MEFKEARHILLKLIILTASVILLSTVYVFAADNTTTVEEKGYSWLTTQLGDNCASSGATDQIAFSLLAMAYNSGIQEDCSNALLDRKKENCFAGSSSSSTCNIKSTALAILALDSIEKDVNKSTTWLLNKKDSNTGLDWFLEIDSNNATNCKITFDGTEHKFEIKEDKKIVGSSNCLSTAEQDYFLNIDKSCLNKNFTISCDQIFITTLLYKKPGSDVYYVSSESHQSSGDGTTQEQVESYCFKDGSTCSYEGTLWAVLALKKQGERISSYIPYISAMADEAENKLYFPSAFLYMFEDQKSNSEYYSQIIEKQINNNHWKATSSSDEYYDTALGILALNNGDAVSNVKDYLSGKQDESGSWNNNVRDTAFILYVGWQKAFIPPEIEPSTDCESLGDYCIASCNEEDKAMDSDGFLYYCYGMDDVCCKKPAAPEPTCSQKNGSVCSGNQECQGGSYVSSLNSPYCCLEGTCTEITTQTNACEDASYTCSLSCSDNQEDVTSDYPCINSGDVCCMEKTTSSRSYLWIIILLIVLIILVILAIIFRNQLRMWLFKKKSGARFENGPSSINRPPMNMPPTSPLLSRPRQIIPRPMPPQPIKKPMGRQPAKSSAKSDKEKDFDETMKKLKEMSK